MQILKLSRARCGFRVHVFVKLYSFFQYIDCNVFCLLKGTVFISILLVSWNFNDWIALTFWSQINMVDWVTNAKNPNSCVEENFISRQPWINLLGQSNLFFIAMGRGNKSIVQYINRPTDGSLYPTLFFIHFNHIDGKYKSRLVVNFWILYLPIHDF